MMHKDSDSIHIIGGGLAGCEAAWQISKYKINVIIHEMRPVKSTEAHKTANLSELVCSNSFRSDDKFFNAVGLLHEEMRELDSLIMKSADKSRLPAGSALAVDRELFSKTVEDEISKNSFIQISREEIKSLPVETWGKTIIATGPLTSNELSLYIKSITNEKNLAFFDALSPIVYFDSINFDKSWFQSRYDKGEGKDYINCPMTKDEYYSFIKKLKESQKIVFKEWEKDTPYFEGCMPIEIMAERGDETLRHGPMKPFGLTNPKQPQKKPYAVIQLRQDNLLRTLWSIVGFQTKMTYASQKDIFRMIPGLEKVEFARFGGLHRNTFINSPVLLDKFLRLKTQNDITFAGQITGVEGYVESAAIGLLAGIFNAQHFLNIDIQIPPNDTAIGSLLNHITTFENSSTFQPMNINFGLFQNKHLLNKNKKISKVDRRKKLCIDALKAINIWSKKLKSEIV